MDGATPTAVAVLMPSRKMKSPAVRAYGVVQVGIVIAVAVLEVTAKAETVVYRFWVVPEPGCAIRISELDGGVVSAFPDAPAVATEPMLMLVVVAVRAPIVVRTHAIAGPKIWFIRPMPSYCPMLAMRQNPQERRAVHLRMGWFQSCPTSPR
jgi:hypothetical protein